MLVQAATSNCSPSHLVSSNLSLLIPIRLLHSRHHNIPRQIINPHPLPRNLIHIQLPINQPLPPNLLLLQPKPHSNRPTIPQPRALRTIIHIHILRLRSTSTSNFLPLPPSLPRRAKLLIKEKSLVGVPDSLPPGVQVVDVFWFRERDVFGVLGEGVFDWCAVAEGGGEDAGGVCGAQGGEEFGADGGEGLLGVDVQEDGGAVELEA